MAPVAQWIEHLVADQKVVSSSLAGRATDLGTKRALRVCRRGFLVGPVPTPVLERFEVEHREAGLRDLVHRLRVDRVSGIAIERPDGPVVDALLAAGLEVVDSGRVAET